MKRISLVPFVFSLFIILFVPVRELQFPALLFLLLYVISFVISRYLYLSVSVERNRDLLYCPSRAPAAMELSVVNRGILSLNNAIVTDRATGCYGHGVGQFREDFPARGKRNFSCAVNTFTRGKFSVGPISVKGGDPFNFFPWEKIFPASGSIIVYPDGHSISLILKEGEQGGSVKAPELYYEDPTYLKGIRDYRPGDPLKRINWKASARTGSLQTMEFSRRMSAPLVVLLDLTIDHYPLKHRHILLERAIEAAASLVISYGEAGQFVSLMAAGTERPVLMPPGRGYGAVIAILEELARISFSEKGDDSEIISSFLTGGFSPAEGTHVALLIPRSDLTLLKEMEILRRRKCSLSVIATGGTTLTGLPPYCRSYILSEYGKEYFNE